jgi:hypothetical protein
MLEDYIFDDHLRYEGHKLIYTFPKPTEEPIVIGGILGAAILCVRLINTDEQHSREIVLDEKLHYEPFYIRYEQEVIGDDWGYIAAELEQLDLAYMELYSQEQVTLETLCPNIRQLSIAMDVLRTYMHRISIEQYGEHIYDLVKWTMPFAQWLYNAAQVEPLRQRFLTMAWTDPALVHGLAEDMTNGKQQEPLCVFDGEQAADIMQRYWDWLWDTVQQQAALFPASKTKIAEYKQLILEEENNYYYLKPEMKDFTEDQLKLFNDWVNGWVEFVEEKIKPKKAITFWTKDVTEEQQEALLDYIKYQEKQPQRYKCLAVAVYSLRQLGYVTYNIAPSSIAKWLSERLQNDYSTKNELYQFRRAWNELSRYNPAVQDEVARLIACGVKSITSSSQHIRQ